MLALIVVILSMYVPLCYSDYNNLKISCLLNLNRIFLCCVVPGEKSVTKSLFLCCERARVSDWMVDSHMHGQF